MTIVTKFNVKETVFVMLNNEVAQKPVRDIVARINQDGEVVISYYLGQSDKSTPEDKCFESKQALIDSL